LRLILSPMTREDLEEVMNLEWKSFSSPWTRGMYVREINKPEGCYLTARSHGVLAGYGGALVILDEAHVMTLAVREDCRRQGVATRILIELIGNVQAKGARFLTLEVRKSNQVAIDLYSKLGFQIMGERKNYYIDNLENALIMWTEDITVPEHQELLRDMWGRYKDAGPST
jgi:[ribosomal protein S18]-alanine N-acetyltransferase